VTNATQFKALSVEEQERALRGLRSKHNKSQTERNMLETMKVIMDLTKDNELLTKDNELLTKDNELLTKDNELLTKEIVDTTVLTGNEFCSQLRFRGDFSTSTAHFHKDERAVIHDADEELLIDMPPEFYKCRCFPCFKSTFLLGEADTEKAFNVLVDAVIQALHRIGYLPENFILVTSSQVNLLGAIPDIGLFAGVNRYLCGVIEVKKHVVKVINNIFDSESRGSGQVFEQLALCKMFLRGESYGLISTFNAARLLSTGNFKSDLAKLREKLASASPPHEPLQRSTDPVPHSPDRLGPEIDFDEELDYDLTELLSQEEGQDPETAQDMQRELYGFERVELGCYGDFEGTIDAKNRKMLQTIANFVLLAANAVKDTRKIGRTLEGGSRVFDVETGSFHLRKVSFDRGIDIFGLPDINDTKFYVWSQLGVGSSGTCCLGTVRREVEEQGKLHFYGALCVVKIYHTRHINSEDETESLYEKAELEAANWGTVYADEKWDFIRVHRVHPLVFLIMPYFCVPNNPKEREELLGLAGTKKEESLLWKGLERFASKGKKHCDLKWHHVGVYRRKDSNGQVEKLVYLLDLESLEDLHPRDMESWVVKSYEELGSRANLDEKKQAGVARFP
jgi:Family of unknown function (DUF5898)